MYNEPKKTKDKLTIIIYCLFLLSTLCKWDAIFTSHSSHNVLHLHTVNVLSRYELGVGLDKCAYVDLNCKICILWNIRMHVHLRTNSSICSDVSFSSSYSSLGTCTWNSLTSKIYLIMGIVSPQSRRKFFRNSNTGYSSYCWLLSLGYLASIYG